MPSRGPAGLAEFSNGMERPGVFQTVCLPAECFSLSLSLSLSASSSTLDRHQSSFVAGSLNTALSSGRLIDPEIFQHLCQGFVSSSFASNDEITRHTTLGIYCDETLLAHELSFAFIEFVAVERRFFANF